MFVLSKILLSGLYGLGVSIRHMLYDQFLLPSFSVGVPTICVGNLAVGGTGKTPMVQYLAGMLMANGYHPAVLSRGYKRATHGFILADKTSTCDTIGDEPMQIHNAFPNLPVAVCESRVHGAKKLLRIIDDLDVIIFDDAMQHRPLRCGYTILLTPYDRLYVDDHLLPWGRLRDIPSRALQADDVVVTKCPQNIQPIDMRVVENRLHLPFYQRLHFTGIQYEPVNQEGNPLVVCGIAQPQYLMEHVLAQYPQAQLLAFRDHHKYGKNDFKKIVNKMEHFDFVITTEKDWERLVDTPFAFYLDQLNKPIVIQRISTRFYSPQDAFDKHILNYIHENRRK